MGNGSISLRPAPHLPGEPGIWVFILGDLFMFAALFINFMNARATNEASYIDGAGTLNQHLGALNTFLMLTSSWFVAQALRAARTDLFGIARRLITGAFCCGLGFVLVKYVEYDEKLGAGLTPATNDFFMYYFLLTGLHLMHVVLGMGVLVWMRHVALRLSPVGDHIRALESGASFWHMVDILWIVLFALLYLVK